MCPATRSSPEGSQSSSIVKTQSAPSCHAFQKPKARMPLSIREMIQGSGSSVSISFQLKVSTVATSDSHRSAGSSSVTSAASSMTRILSQGHGSHAIEKPEQPLRAVRGNDEDIHRGDTISAP